MRSLLFFLLFWSVLAGCKNRVPVENTVRPDFMDEMRKMQNIMERSFIAEHDLFIQLYDRSNQKEEIPYPQLHILIDSIQDFRNMHGVLLEYILGENEKLSSSSLGNEGKELVKKRIADAKSEADKVVGSYSQITYQIANLKMLYQISRTESRDWLRDQHFKVNALQTRLDAQTGFLKAEAVRLGLNFEDTENPITNPETDRYAELVGAHAFCLSRMVILNQELVKVELSLGESTLYEGPFIDRPAVVIDFENAYSQVVHIMKEFDFLKQ